MPRYIDAEVALQSFCAECNHTIKCEDCDIIFHLETVVPTADVVEVVRCRDCVMWDGSFTLNGQKKCLNMTFCTDGDFYCWWGSKKDE